MQKTETQIPFPVSSEILLSHGHETPRTLQEIDEAFEAGNTIALQLAYDYFSEQSQTTELDATRWRLAFSLHKDAQNIFDGDERRPMMRDAAIQLLEEYLSSDIDTEEEASAEELLGHIQENYQASLHTGFPQPSPVPRHQTVKDSTAPLAKPRAA